MSVLAERELDAVRQAFAALERDVHLRLELGTSSEGAVVLTGRRELDPGPETLALVEQVSGLSEWIRLTVEERDEPGRYPALALGDGLVFHGLPWGYELSSLVYGIVAAGSTASPLEDATLASLQALEGPVELEVYVTPT
jgi:alkyl hydroperoxide reductase subunit AhpF